MKASVDSKSHVDKEPDDDQSSNDRVHEDRRVEVSEERSRRRVRYILLQIRHVRISPRTNHQKSSPQGPRLCITTRLKNTVTARIYARW